MSPPAPQIRVVAGADLGAAPRLAEAEGWNPGVNDAARLHAADPEGFPPTPHESRAAASVSVVRIGPAHGFLHLRRPELRGRGLGMAVRRTGMARMA